MNWSKLVLPIYLNKKSGANYDSWMSTMTGYYSSAVILIYLTITWIYLNFYIFLYLNWIMIIIMYMRCINVFIYMFISTFLHLILVTQLFLFTIIYIILIYILLLYNYCIFIMFFKYNIFFITTCIQLICITWIRSQTQMPTECLVNSEEQ